MTTGRVQFYDRLTLFREIKGRIRVKYVLRQVCIASSMYCVKYVLRQGGK